MTARLLPEPLQAVERRVRLLSILSACADAGVTPTPIANVHLLAYFTDALAPVWHLPVLDGQVLKRRRQPFFPAMQRDLDRLVGMGLVRVLRFGYMESDERDGWRLDADFEPIVRAVAPIMEEIERHDQQREMHMFVREVVLASSGLGTAGISELGELDATYSSSGVDIGGLIDMIEAPIATVRAARRFENLSPDTGRLASAELIHLYVRHLYARMRVA
jgi:hypothetical protein